jgi:sorbitol-specific phosphotransferase system component IIC
MLTAFVAANVLSPHPWAGIFSDANFSMLQVFLAANLLTGSVNLSIDTLAVGKWGAFGIVVVYTLVICGLACAVASRRVMQIRDAREPS